MQKQDIIDLFKDNPDALINNLIMNKSLKGPYREILIDTLLSSMDDPKWHDYLWLMLLPRRISLVTVDNFCNLACRMCGGSKGKMEWIKPENLRNILGHCPTTEVITFVAGNSEPMLNPDLPENFKILNEHNIRSTFVTNGHYLNRKNISAMIETQQPYSVNVSLDAIDPKIYKDIRGADNTKVIKGLFDLLAAKEKAGVQRPEISLLMVGMEDNISELSKFVKLAHETNAIRVHVDHMLGSSRPGDFTLNPEWRMHMVEALELAQKLDVTLQLPLDSMQILEREGLLPKIEQVADNRKVGAKAASEEYHDGASCGVQAVTLDNIKESKEKMKTGNCPWIQDIHVNIDGAIRPCCNMPANMGNLYETPLWENQNFLQTRIHHSKGEIERLCMGNSNCIYVQELKQKNIRPRFFRKETILKKITKVH
ncbi:MAG: radical SAM protein [Lentisphaeraceae bacterium]|nr:radical SAM protein [Lentisphaeraceae bacterium]